MTKRRQVYESDEDVSRARWIRPELAPAARVAEQVARCPSGALQSRVKATDAAKNPTG